MLTSQWQKVALRRRWYIILMCAGTWFLLFLGPFSIAIWPIIITAFAATFYWRSWQPLLIPLLSPLTLGFMCGVTAWFLPNPQFGSMGLPHSESFNLDPVTRCYQSTGGCKVYGSEWMLLDSKNCGLRTIAALLGPPRGAYHGPYPTKEQALQATHEAEATPLKMFQEGTVLVGTNKYRLEKGFVEQFLLDFTIFPNYLEDEDESRQLQAAVYEKQCLMLRVSMKNVPTMGKSSNEPEGIVLIDLATMKPFALYVLSGQVSRIPRVLTR